jgi:hypothetical protein
MTETRKVERLNNNSALSLRRHNPDQVQRVRLGEKFSETSQATGRPSGIPWRMKVYFSACSLLLTMFREEVVDDIEGAK